jgi:LemA protein
MGPLIVIVVVVVVVLLGVWLTYNGFVKKRNRTQEAWAQIDVELKRRHDLIPNLVSTVQGYASHERETFEAVTNARAAAVGAGATGDPNKIGPAENVLTQSLRTLFAVAENYPQLKAAENFLALQEQLTATEDKLAFARRYYNASVRDYNTALQSFPRNIIASTFGHFQAAEYFKIDDDDDRAVPQVGFPGASGAPAASAASSAPTPPPAPMPPAPPATGGTDPSPTP